jgi:hypothetical protein
MTAPVLDDDDVPPCALVRTRDYRDLVIEPLSDDVIRLRANQTAMVNVIGPHGLLGTSSLDWPTSGSVIARR